MRKDLDKRCEEMRLRNEETRLRDIIHQEVNNLAQQDTTPLEQKPLCANCKRRVCRRGSPLCSRCTYKGIQTKLRDTLPGVIKDELRIDDVERKLDGRKTLLDEATDGVIQNFLHGEGSSDPKLSVQLDGLLQPQQPQDECQLMIGADDVCGLPPDSPIHTTSPDRHDFVPSDAAVQEKFDEDGLGKAHPFEEAFGEQPPQGSHYTRKQVSQMVGVSPTTIIRWERKGVIPLPKRFAHNNQLIYTDEIITAIKEYASQIIVTQYVPLPPKTPQELAARGTTTRKTFKINKKLERAVAQRVSVTGFRGAGKLA
jgi:hypothetical protein